MCGWRGYRWPSLASAPRLTMYESLIQKAKSGQKLTTGEIKWLATVHMKVQTDKIMVVWVQIMDALHPLGQDIKFHNLTNDLVGKYLRGEN